jgi:hypothetical protein
MGSYPLILFLALTINCAGCQMMTGITDPIKKSLNNAAVDYDHVTSGSGSSYIQGQRPHS